MIVHVLRRAEAAKIGRVAVATDTPEIAAAVKAHGGEAVMTRADHPSGSDRIYEALGKLDPHGARPRSSINLQGDFPTIPPDNIRDVLRAARRPRGRYRDAGGRNPHRGREHTSPERGEGGRLADRRHGGCARFISPAPPRLTATGRATTISASTPIAAPRWSASSACRPRRWNGRRSSNSSARWKPACASTSPSSIPCRAGSTPPADLETARQHPCQNLSGCYKAP